MLSNYVSYLFRPSANQIEHFLRQKTKNLHLIHLVKVVNKKTKKDIQTKIIKMGSNQHIVQQQQKKKF